MTMATDKQKQIPLDTELEDLPQEMRWREWMGRVEAVIFASPKPVTREALSLVVGESCNVDLIIEDIQEELQARPYELVFVAGGWHHRTRPRFVATINLGAGMKDKASELSKTEMLVLASIAYQQPITRADLGQMFGKEISRDLISRLRSKKLIDNGPRSPQPGAPYTYVTTPEFLSTFGLENLGGLPDLEMLEDAGLLETLEGEDSLLNEMPLMSESEFTTEGSAPGVLVKPETL